MQELHSDKFNHSTRSVMMFRVYDLLVLSLIIVGVEAYGNDECIKKGTNIEPGFLFKTCISTVEVAMKWKKTHNVRLLIITESKDVSKFKLILNDECKLDFEGKRGNNEYAKWTNANGTVTNCSTIKNCNLQIKSGKLMTYTTISYLDKDVGCGNVRNKLEDQWVWSKFQIKKLPAEYELKIFVLNGRSEEDEGTEYIPAVSNTSDSDVFLNKLDGFVGLVALLFAAL
ncbi:hypothetical protein M3Y96_00519500 [Aphelenchoides besseyi]|nr:hypothetical protein M3Y96_00519500 [Aphelenchoides besseyi]